MPLRTLISSSSAQPSAAHGDPRLPNLKRRLPDDKKKKQLRRQVSTARDNLMWKAVEGVAASPVLKFWHPPYKYTSFAFSLNPSTVTARGSQFGASIHFIISLSLALPQSQTVY